MAALVAAARRAQALPLLRTPILRRAGALPALAQPPRRFSSTEPLEYASSCFLPTSWHELPLVAKREYNHDSTIYSFGLPYGQSLNLPVCACLLLRAPGADGAEPVVRPYTPISTTEKTGSFDLLVKRYDGGAASQYLHGLALGQVVGFKHIKFNIKAQYPFEGKATISMLCAGTGVTPMLQALQKLVDTPGDARPISVLYGSKSVGDILMREELEALVRRAGGRVRLVHVVGDAPTGAEPPGWAEAASSLGVTPALAVTAETGWVDEAKIAAHCYPPADDTLVFVCGLPAMYDALCGPRTEPALAEGSVLQRLGYQAHMVAKM